MCAGHFAGGAGTPGALLIGKQCVGHIPVPWTF